MPFMAPHVKTARLHLQKVDPVMKRLLKEHGPFTAKTNPDRFGSLIDSIISQQISGSAATTIQSRLRQAVGEKLASGQTGGQNERQKGGEEGGGKVLELTPARLLRFEPKELQQLGVSRQKAGYLLDLAEKLESGQIQLAQIHKKDDQQVIAELTQIRGIGRWTAQMFLIFSLARMDVLPVDDLGLKNAIHREYQLHQPPTPAEIAELATPWRPYATVASWYLWRSLDPRKDSG
jgi:DNA-3-methyladenine glycosylase II